MQQRGVVTGGQAELGAALAQAVKLGDAGTAPRVSARSSAGVTPAATSGRQTWSVPAMTALRRNWARRSSSSATASPSKDGDEAGLGGYAGVDLVGGEVVFEDDLGRGDARAPR